MDMSLSITLKLGEECQEDDYDAPVEEQVKNKYSEQHYSVNKEKNENIHQK